MATIGRKLTCNTTTICGSGSTVGQGNFPELWALYSTDDASTSVPSWTDATSRVRSFSVSRGRSSELEDVDAGHAQITVDNRSRTFDTNSNSSIRPLNQWWLRSQFSGETQDMFKGYALSYDLQYPAVGKDAVAVVNCADEFMVLNLARLPVTDPPRDTYSDVVQFDNPNAYWTFNIGGAAAQALATPFQAVVGPQLDAVGGAGFTGPGPVRGGEGEVYSVVYKNGLEYFQTPGLSSGEGGDVAGLSAFTVEVWYQTDTPTTAADLIKGPTAGGASTWRLYQDSGGHVIIEARNSTGTVATASSGVLTANTWYHVVGVLDSGTLSIYINGSSVASSALSGSFSATIDANAFLRVGDSGISGTTFEFDELAVYRTALSAARISAHYTAGLRGYLWGQLPHERAISVLDTVSSRAPRSIATGTRYMVGARMKGQPALEELRKTRMAELPDGNLFTSKSGVVTLLDAAHRSSGSYATVQATFGDSGGTSEISYVDVTMDYSDSFLFNTWNVTRTGGTLSTYSDSTSISSYFTRTQSVEVPITTDSAVGTIGAAYLSKYKDPLQRITSIQLTAGVPAQAQTAFARDIGDRIEVKRRPVGGGTIDQTSFIQNIRIDGDASNPAWNIAWGISPV